MGYKTEGMLRTLLIYLIQTNSKKGGLKTRIESDIGGSIGPALELMLQIWELGVTTHFSICNLEKGVLKPEWQYEVLHSMSLECPHELTPRGPARFYQTIIHIKKVLNIQAGIDVNREYVGTGVVCDS